MICAAWIILSDGCVARCDHEPNHSKSHYDSVIGIGFTKEMVNTTKARLGIGLDMALEGAAKNA